MTAGLQTLKIKSLPQENEYNTEYTMLYYNSRQDFSFVVSTKLKLLPVILKTSFESSFFVQWFDGIG